jgi:hypothetical protein
MDFDKCTPATEELKSLFGVSHARVSDEFGSYTCSLTTYDAKLRIEVQHPDLTVAMAIVKTAYRGYVRECERDPSLPRGKSSNHAQQN